MFLTTITSGIGILDIQALGYKPPYCCHFPDRVVLRTLPQHHPKENKPFHWKEDIVLPTIQKDLSNLAHELDVGSILKLYVQNTAFFRKAEHFLSSQVG